MSRQRSSADVETPERGMGLVDALLESSRPLAPLPGAAHARVKRRLKVSLRRSQARRPRWLQPVLVSGVMLICGAAFGIALDRLLLQPLGSTDPRPPAAAAKPSRRPKAKPPAPATAGVAQPPSETAPLAPVAPPIAPAVSPPPSGAAEATTGATATRIEGPAPGANRPASPLPKLAMRAVPARASRPAEPPVMAAELPPPAPAAVPLATAPVVAPAPLVAPAPVKVAPPATDGLSEERLLSAAVRALRAQRDPSSALLALDEYRARFPHGRLAVEANALHVDALVALHRDGEALLALDGMDLVRMPGGLERQLQRGELRLSARRWQDAETDLDNVLAHARGHARDVSERALFGRARCRLGLGDKRGARAAADEYLRRFPQGRFAAQVDRLALPDPPSAP
jgi:hypothetical protein